MNQRSNNQNFSEPKAVEILQKHKNIFSENGTVFIFISGLSVRYIREIYLLSKIACLKRTKIFDA